jgi:hypothetical protein
MKIASTDAPSTAPGAPVPPVESWPRVDGDTELLPDGRQVKDVNNHELNRMVRQVGVAVSPMAGRDVTVAAYIAHLTGIHDEAGRAAVQAWLASKRDSAP